MRRSGCSSSASTAGRSAAPRGCVITNGGPDVTERFSPGSYVNLTDAEALNRPPFDLLPSGRVLSLPDPALHRVPDRRRAAR